MEDKLAVITGASGPIGVEIAKKICCWRCKSDVNIW
jgi:short-subunit dehydrogenase